MSEEKLKEDKDKTTMLQNLIIELSKPIMNVNKDKKIDEVLGTFDEIYIGDFRHHYSDLFAWISDFNEDPDISVEDLTGNIKFIYETGCCLEHDSEVMNHINKLWDHVNLEYARIKYSESRYDNKDIFKKMGKAERKTNTLIDITEKLLKKVNNSQKESVAILGIFAAVVISFTGGVAFSTSVLSNINQASIYRIVLAILLLGIVLINIFGSLTYFIFKTIDREKKYNWIPQLIVSIIFIVALIVNSVFWYFGFVEKRNIKMATYNVNQQSESQSEQKSGK